MQGAAQLLDHTHVTERVEVANIPVPCMKLGGKNKPFHQSAENDLAFLGAVKNLPYISKTDFALEVHIEKHYGHKMHEGLGECLVLAES